jgi:hypothetical protein
VRSVWLRSSGDGGWSSRKMTMPWMAIVIVASNLRTSSQKVRGLKPLLSATDPPASSIEYVIPVPAV